MQSGRFRASVLPNGFFKGANVGENFSKNPENAENCGARRLYYGMEYLTSSQAAELLGVSPDTLRIWDRHGILEPTKTAGGHRRYLKSHILSLQREETKTKEEPLTNHKSYLEGVFARDNFHLNLDRWINYYDSAATIHAKNAVPFISFVRNYDEQSGKVQSLTFFEIFFFESRGVVRCKFPLAPTKDDTEAVRADKDKLWNNQHFSYVSYRDIKTLDLNRDHPKYPNDIVLRVTFKGSESISLIASNGSRENGDQIMKIYDLLRHNA